MFTICAMKNKCSRPIQMLQLLNVTRYESHLFIYDFFTFVEFILHMVVKQIRCHSVRTIEVQSYRIRLQVIVPLSENAKISICRQHQSLPWTGDEIVGKFDASCTGG